MLFFIYAKWGIDFQAVLCLTSWTFYQCKLHFPNYIVSVHHPLLLRWLRIAVVCVFPLFVFPEAFPCLENGGPQLSLWDCCEDRMRPCLQSCCDWHVTNAGVLPVPFIPLNHTHTFQVCVAEPPRRLESPSVCLCARAHVLGMSWSLRSAELSVLLIGQPKSTPVRPESPYSGNVW